MSTAPYYDQKLSKDQLKNMFTRLGAKHSVARSKPDIMVYKLDNGGEAMVEKAGDRYRIRLFVGKCAC